MNERIYELYKLSHIDYKGSKAFDPAKFAEMIVNECLTTIAMHDLGSEVQARVLHNICDEIKEYLCKEK